MPVPEENVHSLAVVVRQRFADSGCRLRRRNGGGRLGAVSFAGDGSYLSSSFSVFGTACRLTLPLHARRMDYPTPQNIAEWDDASLFATTGYYAATRASAEGFGSLNEPERILYCLFELVGNVFNGGFGHWLSNADPQVIGHTAWACEAVGAESASLLVTEVLAPLRNPLTTDEWWDYWFSLSDEQHMRLEAYTTPFEEVQQELHRCAYRYARERWAEVRTA